MTPNDFTRFRAVMTGLAKTFDKEIDGPMLDAYWLALKDWPLEEFESAAAHLLRTSEFMPRPAHFVQLRKAGGMTPGEAWEAALTHARTGAYRAGPALPEVERTVRAIGGWSVIAMSSQDGLPFLERRFSERFTELLEVDSTREALPQIAATTWKGRLSGPAPIGQLVANLGPKR